MSEPEIARRCPSCGISIREVALFCPQCGDAQLSEPPALAGGTPIDAAGKSSKPPANAGNSNAKAEPAKASMGQATRGAVGARIQRATNLARDVEGDVIHRARKVRQISGVVIDEAGYDPSLRFVLVAVILFLLFLIIVLLNKFIT